MPYLNIIKNNFYELTNHIVFVSHWKLKWVLSGQNRSLSTPQVTFCDIFVFAFMCNQGWGWLTDDVVCFQIFLIFMNVSIFLSRIVDFLKICSLKRSYKYQRRIFITDLMNSWEYCTYYYVLRIFYEIYIKTLEFTLMNSKYWTIC